MKTSCALVLLSTALPFCVAYIEEPPTTADANTVSDCSWWVVAATGDTCTAIAEDWSISVSDFELVYNPSVGSTCKLILGNSYCVERNYGLPGTTSTTTSTPTTTAGNGISTPTPTQTGMVANCNKFYFVQSGDGCANIASTQGIALSDFYSWNPAVKTDCSGLWASTYVCVGLIGQTTSATTTTTSTITTTTTSAGNGVVTPTPTQTGMAANCNTFYFVQSGDGCAAIASKFGISLANFYSWNPAVKTDCSALWASVYVCVGLIGSTPTTTLTTSTTKTTAGNGVATPTPTQPLMVGNCDAFHLVASGDTCYDVSAKAGITLTQFYTWNPSVGSSCQTLQLGYYVCISLI